MVDIPDFIPIRNASTLFDRKIDEQLLSQRDIENTWDELVVAGPIIVNYIGNLMVLASKKDFAFTLPTPNHIYQYMKYPNSFRATLVQVANQISNAFFTAHTNMDTIQVNMQQIPTHLKTVLKLLTSASPRLIQTMLPTALGNIERIAKQCANAANMTKIVYNSVTNLLHEVAQETISTQGSTENSVNSTANLTSQASSDQTLLNSELQFIRERYEEARIVLLKAREDYYNAYHAIPTRPKLFVGYVLATFAGGVTACIFSSCFSSKPPHIDNTPFENAKEKAELALKQLLAAEAKYDEWYSKMLEKQNKLAGIIMQISLLDLSQTDYQSTIDILISATLELGEIQKQWTNMTSFFTALAIRAEATRETILYEFIETIKNVTLISGVLDDADREFFVWAMQDTADDIDRGAHLLYLMATTYYDISNKYIINQISEMTGLVVTQTDSERQSRLKKLAQDTLDTSGKVSRMALDRKQQYEQRNQARQREYERYLQQVTLNEITPSIGK